MRSYVAAIVCLALSSPAFAEVRTATDAGFDIAATVEIGAPPSDVYAVLVTPSRWWNSAHTYSGDAANLRLDREAGGCFCEALPDETASGSVEHARVIFARPGKSLRLSGALGPLQNEAAIGTLTFVLKPMGRATSVTMTYLVGGYIRGGAAALALPVDSVMVDQLQRLRSAAEKRAP